MRMSNDFLAKRQLENLREQTLFALNINVDGLRQSFLVADVQKWAHKFAVDHQPSMGPVVDESKFTDIFNGLSENFRPDKYSFFTYDSKYKANKTGGTLRYILLKGDPRNATFYLKNSAETPIYKLCGSKFEAVRDDFPVSLPPGTLIFAEEKFPHFSLIECFFIFYEDVRGKSFLERSYDCQTLSEILNRGNVKCEGAKWIAKPSLSIFQRFLNNSGILLFRVYPDGKSHEENVSNINETFLSRKLISVFH